MNVMNEILEKIQAYDTIIIHRHQNPDPDAVEVPKFMLQTYEGEIQTIAARAVNGTFDSDAHAGETVELNAPLVNAAGAAFKGWRVVAV